MRMDWDWDCILLLFERVGVWVDGWLEMWGMEGGVGKGKCRN